MNFDMNTLLYVLLGTLILPMLKKIFPNLTIPSKPIDPNAPPAPTPADTSGIISQIVEALFRMLMERFLPVMQAHIRQEIKQSLVVDPAAPKIEQTADGKFLIQLAK